MVEAVHVSFQHQLKYGITQSWGIAAPTIPKAQVFPGASPLSLYIILSKKKDLQGDAAKFRGCPAYERDFPGFLTDFFSIVPRNAGVSFISEDLHRSLIARPVFLPF